MAPSDYESSFGYGHAKAGFTEHTTPRPSSQTSRIREDAFCKGCGWPVVLAFCNDGMAHTAPYSSWDNWIYCSNKTCHHHGGEGIYHNMPDWIKTTGGF